MPTKNKPLHICRESFVGSLGEKTYTFTEGVSILDSDNPEDAKLLKAWGKFFEPVKEE
jgi:hypothetical protein